MASNDTDFGARLRAARVARRLTQVEVAERLAEIAFLRHRVQAGVAADMISKWERGTKRPSKQYRELLCLLFDSSPELLGLAPGSDSDEPCAFRLEAGGTAEVPWAEILLALGRAGYLLHRQLIDEWESELMQRRAVLKSMGLTAVAASLDKLVPPVARSARLAEPLRADQETIAGLRELAAAYQRMYHVSTPPLLIAPIKAHLRTVEDLVRATEPDRVRRQLLANHSQVAQLAGRIAFFDLHDSLAARGYLMSAYDSAVAARDPSLAASAIGHLSFVSADARSWGAADDHLGRARSLANRSAPPIIVSWLNAVSSEVHASAGDERRALADLEHAHAALERDPQAFRPAWFDYYDRARLHGFEGYVLLKLNRSGPAVRVLQTAIERLDDTATKQRTVFLADLATARVQQGDVDEACRLAMHAARELSQRRYATSVARLHVLRSTLQPFATSRAVRQLDRAMVDV